MLQYDLAKFALRDRYAAADEARLARELRGLGKRQPLRVVVGRRLVRFGLRLAAAQG